MKKNKGKVVNFSMYSGYNFTKDIGKEKKETKTNKKKKKIKKVKKNNHIKNNGIKWKLFLILLFVLALVLFCLFTPLFNIEKIEVEGVADILETQKIQEVLNEAIDQVKSTEKNKDVAINFSKYTKQDIIDMSEIIFGNNIFKEDLKKAKEKIEKGSYIKTVEIARKLPNTILIKITEREIKAYVNYVGTYMCIDETGFVIDSIPKQEKKENIPIVDGINPLDLSKGFKIGEILDADEPIKLQRIVSLLTLVQKNEINVTILKIDAFDKDNITITIENGDKQVNFGDMSNVNIKIVYLKEILEKTVGKKGIIYMNSESDDFKPIFAETIGG